MSHAKQNFIDLSQRQLIVYSNKVRYMQELQILRGAGG